MSLRRSLTAKPFEGELMTPAQINAKYPCYGVWTIAAAMALPEDERPVDRAGLERYCQRAKRNNARGGWVSARLRDTTIVVNKKWHDRADNVKQREQRHALALKKLGRVE